MQWDIEGKKPQFLELRKALLTLERLLPVPKLSPHTGNSSFWVNKQTREPPAQLSLRISTLMKG